MFDVQPDGVTIQAAAARCGLPESTLRYWERIGLVRPVHRDASSGHRRYRPEDVQVLETLANLRAVGLSIEDMRSYLRASPRGDAAAHDQAELFAAHASRLQQEIVALELRLRYLDLKVRYWRARAAGEFSDSDRIAAELSAVIRQINPKEA